MGCPVWPPVALPTGLGDEHWEGEESGELGVEGCSCDPGPTVIHRGDSFLEVGRSSRTGTKDARV